MYHLFHSIDGKTIQMIHLIHMRIGQIELSEDDENRVTIKIVLEFCEMIYNHMQAIYEHVITNPR